MKLKLTIRKFQELFAISQMETDEITKSSLLVQCLTDKTEAEIDRMSPEEFGKLCGKVNKAFEIMSNKINESKPRNYVKSNGNWYFLNFDITKSPMNAGRYVEVATFSTDIIGNLHLIMASMANPIKWFKIQKHDSVSHEAIANDMLEMDFEVAYHSAVFFYAVFTKSIQNLHNYLAKQTERKEELAVEMENFKRISDGYIMPNWLVNLKISV